MTSSPPAPGRLSGLQCMALSALFFSLMSLSVKAAGQRLPTFELVFARAVVVSALALADLARRRVAVSGRDAGWLTLRGLVGFVALTCFYWSVVRLPLAEATVIHFTNPVFTALIAAAFLGERLRRRELLLAVAGLLGVVVMVRPASLLGGAAGLPLLPVASSLTAALLSSVAYVLVRRLRHHDAMVVVLAFAGVSSLAALPLMLPSFVWPRGAEWPLLGAVGLTTFFGQLFLTLGLQRERAGRAMTVGYLQIVFATLWGALFFAALPGPSTLLGAAIVVGSTLLLARAEGGGSAGPAPGAPPRGSGTGTDETSQPPARQLDRVDPEQLGAGAGEEPVGVAASSAGGSSAENRTRRSGSGPSNGAMTRRRCGQWAPTSANEDRLLRSPEVAASRSAAARPAASRRAFGTGSSASSTTWLGSPCSIRGASAGSRCWRSTTARPTPTPARRSPASGPVAPASSAPRTVARPRPATSAPGPRPRRCWPRPACRRPCSSPASAGARRRSCESGCGSRCTSGAEALGPGRGEPRSAGMCYPLAGEGLPMRE